MRGPYRPRRGRDRPVRTGRVLLCALCLAGSLPLGSGLSVARSPGRAAWAGSDVLRLAEEAVRAREGYERAADAARAHRERTEEVTRALRGRRIVLSALREDAGAAARAQYRTDGFTASGSGDVSDDPLALLTLQEGDVRRRARLARELEEEGRTARGLDAQEAALNAAQRVLDDDRERLRRQEHTVRERLAEARGRLDVRAQAALDSGRCEPVGLPDLPEGLAVRQEGVAEDREWVRPVESYRLSAGFGGTGADWAGSHTGQDFAVPTGTPVRAVGAGTVVSVGCGGAFGISLVVEHEGGWYSQYAHLAALLASPGQQVRTGQWIGLSGTTGNSTGPHLHFEIRTSPEFGSAVDPVEWLGARGVQL
ncbi:M23 family metallopeptidase [Streptomyces gamaensis]|uniref:M23 family metallopeptidase n=1 Tax=Streptomyces gamaensis TaxID=1763542 RepID=A0ABW0YTC3_9ACTN